MIFREKHISLYPLALPCSHKACAPRVCDSIMHAVTVVGSVKRHLRYMSPCFTFQQLVDSESGWGDNSMVLSTHSAGLSKASTCWLWLDQSVSAAADWGKYLPNWDCTLFSIPTSTIHISYWPYNAEQHSNIFLRLIFLLQHYGSYSLLINVCVVHIYDVTWRSVKWPMSH
mgnify:CR=1 FL=1